MSWMIWFAFMPWVNFEVEIASLLDWLPEQSIETYMHSPFFSHRMYFFVTYFTSIEVVPLALNLYLQNKIFFRDTSAYNKMIWWLGPLKALWQEAGLTNLAKRLQAGHVICLSWVCSFV